MLLPENIDLSRSEQYYLSIRLSPPDGFSFVITCPDNPNIFYYQKAESAKKLSYSEYVQKQIFDLGFFSQQFLKCSVVVVSSNYTLVPEKYFLKAKKEELYNFNFHNASGKILSNNIPEVDGEIIFSISEKLYSFLFRHLWNPEFIHYTSPLIEKFQKYSSDVDSKRCFVDFCNNQISIICYSQDDLISCNSYNATNYHDAIYYIVTVWEKLRLNQNRDFLFISGFSEYIDETIKIMGQLIKNLEVLNFTKILLTTEVFSKLQAQLPTDLISYIS